MILLQVPPIGKLVTESWEWGGCVSTLQLQPPFKWNPQHKQKRWEGQVTLAAPCRGAGTKPAL